MPKDFQQLLRGLRRDAVSSRAPRKSFAIRAVLSGAPWTVVLDKVSHLVVVIVVLFKLVCRTGCSLVISECCAVRVLICIP
jgi:hypothetical protein